MKILMIPSFFKNYKNPSLGIFFLEQARCLKKSGNEVTILYSDTYSLKYFWDYINYKEKNEIIDGIKIIRRKKLSLLKHGNYCNRKPFAKSCLKLFKKNRETFDIIHAQNCVWAGEAAMIISKKFNIPYVITEHASWYALASKKTKKVFNDNVKKILSGSQRLICVSNCLKNSMKNYYNNPEIIGNVVDFKTYNINHVEHNKFTFITVAFLQNKSRLKLKGIYELLEAFSVLVKKEKNVKLKIVGINDNTLIIDIINRLKLNNYIELIPIMEKEKIAGELNKSDSLILLSNYETFGLVLAEAMGCGIPVISSNVGIASLIVNNKTGLICDRNDKNSIVSSMNYIMNNIKKYDSNYIRKSVVNEYSENVIATKIEDVYRSVINEKD